MSRIQMLLDLRRIALRKLIDSRKDIARYTKNLNQEVEPLVKDYINYIVENSSECDWSKLPIEFLVNPVEDTISIGYINLKDPEHQTVFGSEKIFESKPLYNLISTISIQDLITGEWKNYKDYEIVEGPFANVSI